MDSFLCSIETAPATLLPIALEAKSFSANNGLRVGCRQDEGVVCLLSESAINVQYRFWGRYRKKRIDTQKTTLAISAHSKKELCVQCFMATSE